jgi:hypothetical protein
MYDVRCTVYEVVGSGQPADQVHGVCAVAGQEPVFYI